MDFVSYLAPYMDYAVYALIAVGALIVLMVLIRMIGTKVRGKQGNRLGISEFHELDKARRLVLVRRDDIEHLVMIGGPQDVVIEQGIGLEEVTAGSQAMPPVLPEFLSTRSNEQSASITPMASRSPRPAVFGDRAPNLRPVERDEPRLDDTTSENNEKA